MNLQMSLVISYKSISCILGIFLAKCGKCGINECQVSDKTKKQKFEQGRRGVRGRIAEMIANSFVVTFFRGIFFGEDGLKKDCDASMEVVKRSRQNTK